MDDIARKLAVSRLCYDRKMAVKDHLISFAKKRATKKLIKMVPVVGAVFAAGMVYNNVQEKGLKRGALDTALDLTPVIGRVKAVTEFFVGDLIEPSAEAKRNARWEGRVPETA